MKRSVRINAIKRIILGMFFVLEGCAMNSAASAGSSFPQRVELRINKENLRLVTVDFKDIRPHKEPHGLPGALMGWQGSVSPSNRRIAWSIDKMLCIARLNNDAIRVERCYRWPESAVVPHKVIWIDEQVLAVSIGEYQLAIVKLIDNGTAEVVTRLTMRERVNDFAYNDGIMAISVERVDTMMLLRLTEKFDLKYQSHLGPDTDGHHSGDHTHLVIRDNTLFYALSAGHYVKHGNPWSYIRNYFYHPAVFGMYDISDPARPRRLGDVVEFTGISATTTNNVQPILNFVLGSDWVAAFGNTKGKVFGLGDAGVTEALNTPELSGPFLLVNALDDAQLIVLHQRSLDYLIWRRDAGGFKLVDRLKRDLPESAIFGSGKVAFRIGSLFVNATVWDDGYETIDFRGPKPVFGRIRVEPLDLD